MRQGSRGDFSFRCTPHLTNLCSMSDPRSLPADLEKGRQADDMFPLLYQELRQLAVARMAREGSSHTLQPTALVHEAWLRLGADQQPRWANRAHFFSAAAECMRRILIDHARRKLAAREAGAAVPMNPGASGFDFPFPERNEEELLKVHEALDTLARQDPRKAELVKQKYFLGLTLEEAADLLDISYRTAKRDWAFARAWLHAEINRLRL
jgi:RNA polymerase sigma factor (TIGR02999 family)